jgi:hypothetical protein
MTIDELGSGEVRRLIVLRDYEKKLLVEAEDAKDQDKILKCNKNIDFYRDKLKKLGVEE